MAIRFAGMARGTAVAVAACTAHFAPEASLAAEVLIVGADAGANPYVIANSDGTITGFNVDLATEVAKRLGRPGIKIIDQQFSGAKKYEFIIAPVTLTQQRSSGALEDQFLLAHG